MNEAEIREWILQNTELSFSRSGGPGGQYVNTADTKVTLRLPLCEIPLPDRQKERVMAALENRLNASGWLVLQASETRSQIRNRQLIIERAGRLIMSALVPVKKRRPTRPSKASQEARIRMKKARGERKRMRRNPLD